MTNKKPENFTQHYSQHQLLTEVAERSRCYDEGYKAGLEDGIEQGKLDLVELLEKKGYYAIVKKLLKKGKTDSTTTATETMSELSVWLKSQLSKQGANSK